MLNGRLPNDALVILVVLQSVIDPSEHAVTHHGVPVVTALDVFEAAHLMSLWHGIHKQSVCLSIHSGVLREELTTSPVGIGLVCTDG